MPAPSSVSELLELVRQSGLVTSERLDAWLRAPNNAAAASEPQALANLLVRDGLLTEFQARRLLAGTCRGFTIGKYTLLERLGSGGMGTVFLAAHSLMRRRVALKVLPPHRTEDARFLGRFYREARAAAALDHPNIVHAYDVDQDGKLHFIVMEFVDGISLQELIQKRGQLDVTRTAHYARQTATGLEFVHRAGLVHRDIKPANLLLDRKGTVKILDLGLARFYRDPAEDLTQNYTGNSILGTADYLAPEQALDSHTVDIRADIYSLGATLYYLLTGRAPFAGKSVAQKLLSHQSQKPEPVRKLRPDAPKELVAVIEKMMAKDPAQRYQVPSAVAEALAPWTRTPIAPPAEEEMPRLSPAASTAFASDVITPPPTAQGLAASAAPSDTAVSDRARSNGSGQASPNSAAPVATAIAVATAAPLTEPLVLPSGSSLDGLPPARSVLRPSWLLWLGAAAAVAFLVVCLGAAAVAWKVWTGKEPPPITEVPPPTPDEPPPDKPPEVKPAVKPPVKPPPFLAVTKNGTGPRKFGTIGAALKQAKAGDRIVVQDAIHVESLVLEGSPPPNVVIEGNAGEGKPVTWRAPATRPILVLSDVAGLRVKNFVLDGESRLTELATFTGRCPGLTLEGAELRGFTRQAVRLNYCAGKDEDPVVLEKLRVLAGKDTEAAIRLEAGGQRLSQHVRIQDCRFEGPCKAAVQLAGHATSIYVERNRFFQAIAGVQYVKAMTKYRIDLVLTSNTFCEVQKGLYLETPLPAQGEKGLVVAKNNLFARAGKTVQVDGVPAKPGNAAQPQWTWKGNIRDKASTDGPYPFLTTEIKPVPLQTDPADDARFLRYPRNSPLNKAGLNGLPVGVPPVQK